MLEKTYDEEGFWFTDHNDVKHGPWKTKEDRDLHFNEHLRWGDEGGKHD